MHGYDRQCRCESCVNHEVALVRQLDVDKMIQGLEVLGRKRDVLNARRTETRLAHVKLVSPKMNVTVVETAEIAA